MLLHFVLLASKAGILDTQLRAQIDDAEVRARLRRQLPINIFVQFLAGPREVREGPMGFLLRLIAWISLVVGPVALLAFFQLQFLPYHDVWITMWQRIAIVIDLVLLWLLWPTVLYGEAQQAGLAKYRLGRRLGAGLHQPVVGPAGLRDRHVPWRVDGDETRVVSFPKKLCVVRRWGDR